MSTEVLDAPSGAETPCACAHCGLPVPTGLIDRSRAHQFCCDACRSVFAVIHSCGLDRYYELRERMQERRARAAASGRAFGEFDDASFLSLHAHAEPGGRMSIELYLEGVHCVACVWLVEKLPDVCGGVIEARLDLGRSLLRLTWNPARVSLSSAARAIDSLGYVPHPAKGTSAREQRRREDRTHLGRIAIAGALAGNAMLMALALYAGVADGAEGDFRSIFRWISMALGLASILGPGRAFFRGAWAALRTRTRHLDLPIAIGLAAGAVAGVVNTITDTGDLYFDSLTVLIFLLLVGRWVQHRRQRAATDAVEQLFALTPRVARRVEGDVVREVPAETLTPGDLVEVRGDESFPGDVVLERGATSVDMSILTGESRGVEVGEGDEVHAGAVNLGACVRARVIASGTHTRLGRLAALVAESARRRAPIVGAADQLAGRFVVVVLTLATLTFAVWRVIEPSRAVDAALSLLIVTCPCALGLATPLALTTAIGRAARRGIMIKGADVIERIATPGTILLDKTGTLTEGRQRVAWWEGDREVRTLVRALEAHSSHPAARAIADALGDDHPTLRAHDVRHVRGGGVAGVIGGRAIAVGSPAFIENQIGDRLPEHIAAWIDRATRDALTPVVVGVDGKACGALALGDPIRVDARAAIDALRADGWRVRILSGDHPEVVRSVGATLGVPRPDCLGGATPEDKLRIVERELAEGPVVMVGDGVNDAAALARASVGVAVSGGAEASLEAAGVYLTRHGLWPIVELTRSSRRAMGVVRRNMRVSLAYNTLAGTLAVTGLINALIAAVLMPLSSLSVLTLSLRSRTFGDER